MNKVNVLYWIRKNQPLNGKVAIMCRITIDGDRAPDFSTSQFIEYTLDKNNEMIFKRWERETFTKEGKKIMVNDQKVLGSKEDAFLINQHLDNLRNKINHIVHTLEKEEELVTALRVRSLVTGKEKSGHTLLELYQAEVNRKKELVPNEYSQRTVDICQSRLNMVKLFLLDFKKTTDINIRQVDPTFVADFEHWGKSKIVNYTDAEGEPKKKIKWNHNHATRQLSSLKNITDSALKKGLMKIDAFIYKKIKYNKPKFKFLTDDEILAIENRKFNTERLEVIRDIFIFCCYTALAYKDVYLLTEANLVRNNDGSISISKDRKKTDVNAFIPLLDKPKEIIEKYKDNELCKATGKLLPVRSNTKHNEYLKEIGDLCEIKKDLTTHVARHTCATFLLNKGVPPIIVARIMGVSLDVLLSTYGAILQTTVVEEMKALQKRLSAALKEKQKDMDVEILNYLEDSEDTSDIEDAEIVEDEDSYKNPMKTLAISSGPLP